LSNAESFEGLQRLRANRRSLEEKATTLEEKARMEKLAIDKKLAMEILEEENRTHNEAVRELEEKIAKLGQQMKPSHSVESTETQTIAEPAPEISDDVDESLSVGVLPEPEQAEVEVSQEGSKKKKRSLF
jgi:hypothetical protein